MATIGRRYRSQVFRLRCITAFCAGVWLVPASPALSAPSALSEEDARTAKLAGYCLGLATVRSQNFTARFKENGEQMKAVDRDSKAQRDNLQVSGVFLGDMAMSGSNQMFAMYKFLEAFGRARKEANPDPAPMNEGMAQGKIDGASLVNIDNQCLDKCATSKDADSVKSCFLACERPRLGSLARNLQACDVLSTEIAKTTRPAFAPRRPTQ